MIPIPNYNSAKNKLNHFINNGLLSYAKKRNHDYGPNDRNNVSGLSPFIKKRIIHEKEVLQTCLKYYNESSIEKFIQEVFWRTYWKGWLEGRPKVWDIYLKNLEALNNNKDSANFSKDYIKAINGNTSIECFDAWTKELIDYGYLHNHARMWYASIWIFTLNLPWELGANFFYNHLLDADAASNTLSWKWVAGLQTEGKVYKATEENIEKFSKFSFNNIKKLNRISNDKKFEFFEYTEKLFENHNWNDVEFFLVNPLNLSYHDELRNNLRGKKVVLLNDFYLEESSTKKRSFDNLSIEEYIKWLKTNQIEIIEVKNGIELKSILPSNESQIFTYYPSVGYEKNKIEKLCLENKIRIKYIYDEFDKKCWPHAKAGFFKFKSKIHSFIEDL